MLEYMDFPISEYKNRSNQARELMSKFGLKGLLICERTNFHYFSGGYGGVDYSRPTFMLLPLEGEPIVLVHKFCDENRRRETWVKDVRFYYTLQGAPFDMLIEAMGDLGLNEGKVGAELGFEQRIGVSYNDFAQLKELLPRVEFTDAASVFWGVRMIKSKAEIERIRRACQITVKAFELTFPEICEGMSEKDFIDKFLKNQIDLGGESPWGTITSGPENYFCVGQGKLQNYKIKKGNLVWIDAGCTYKHYNSDFCCAGSVGKPSPEQQNMQEIVIKITNNLLKYIRPGIKACEIDALNSAEWGKYGYDYSKIAFGGGRIGHGLGLLSTEPPHIGPEDQTAIQPGMVFTIEPGYPTNFGVFQAEMDVFMNEEGNMEILNKFDQNLRIIATK